MISSKRETRITIDSATGDATMKFNHIKVKNSSEWDPRKTAANQQSQDAVEDSDLIINEDVSVTYYRINTFYDTFPDYLESYEVLHASLSPKFNRDMVFKAGEGAGRSGSFFFFSHDQKFIVKTMTKGELDLYL